MVHKDATQNDTSDNEFRWARPGSEDHNRYLQQAAQEPAAGVNPADEQNAASRVAGVQNRETTISRRNILKLIVTALTGYFLAPKLMREAAQIGTGIPEAVDSYFSYLLDVLRRPPFNGFSSLHYLMEDPQPDDDEFRFHLISLMQLEGMNLGVAHGTAADRNNLRPHSTVGLEPGTGDHILAEFQHIVAELRQEGALPLEILIAPAADQAAAYWKEHFPSEVGDLEFALAEELAKARILIDSTEHEDLFIQLRSQTAHQFEVTLVDVDFRLGENASQGAGGTHGEERAGLGRIVSLKGIELRPRLRQENASLERFVYRFRPDRDGHGMTGEISFYDAQDIFVTLPIPIFKSDLIAKILTNLLDQYQQNTAPVLISAVGSR